MSKTRATRKPSISTTFRRTPSASHLVVQLRDATQLAHHIAADGIVVRLIQSQIEVIIDVCHLDQAIQQDRAIRLGLEAGDGNIEQGADFADDLLQQSLPE